MNKSTTIIFLLTVFQLLHLQAQETIHGRIVDQEDQQPLIGARILLGASGTGTVTDEAGFFELTPQEEQKVLIITYLGYEDGKVDLTKGLEVGTIELMRSSTTLEEVIVSASRSSYSSRFKGSNFRINPIDLANITPLSTEEVLRTIPGVNIVGDMGLSNRPNISIRGSWGRRSKKVLLMEDGTPSAPAPYIAPGAYYNPVSDRITSIEVYKGADMLRYGPNNMYGAVNYITALPPQQPELRVKLIGGQRNYQTGLLSYGGTWNNLGALVEGVYKKFDGFTDHSSVEVLNLNAKIFAQLSDNQSLYFKVSAQSEDNQASLSSQTPFTFEVDPTQNPLDADQFTMRRYGVDVIHKWLPREHMSFTSKVYASDFERDWWRQVTAKVRASEVRDYVGEDIFEERYSYLSGLSFGEEDYVIVGRVIDDRESTTDSRWAYTVTGAKETFKWDWVAFGQTQHLEASANLHHETFADRFLKSDSSRWARSGLTTKDLWYQLWSANGYIRQEFQVGAWGFTPILRFEHVEMFRQDRLAQAQKPGNSSTDAGREPNSYNQFLPGLTVDYRIKGGELYSSIYEGMVAPSKVFGFLVEQNGVVTNPLQGQDINIDPELSWNREIGWRGSLVHGLIDGQLTYFNNTSRNFYAGGRNEVFQELGKINVQGIETSLSLQIVNTTQHQLRIQGNLTLLRSLVLEGSLVDRDLFSQVIHSEATRSEYLEKVNANREAFEVYVSDGAGGEELLTASTLDESDFEDITQSIIQFGAGKMENAEAPYTPRANLNLGITYDWQRLAMGINGNYVSKQFTEFHNFVQESADGAIGQLPAYFTMDAYANYDFSIGKDLNLTAFVNGKNLTNSVYRASRLNRATSGVFPGGFRQIILGINVKI